MRMTDIKKPTAATVGGRKQHANLYVSINKFKRAALAAQVLAVLVLTAAAWLIVAGGAV